MERITLSRNDTSVVEDPGTLRITVYAKRRAWVLAFLAAWFVLWMAAELSFVLPSLGRSFGWEVGPDGEGAPGLLFILGFTAAGAVVGLRLLWCAFGREIFTISPQVLRVRRAVGPVGWTRDFPFADVHRLHLTSGEDPLGLPAWGRMVVGRGGTSIAFRYKGQTYHFARGLDQAETAYLLNVIRQWTQNE